MNNKGESFLVGGDHGGCHPHLVNEFILSILEGRSPCIDEISGATWAAAGISAHNLTINNGSEV